MNAEAKPDVVQCIANVLNSAGDITLKEEDPSLYRKRLALAKQNDIGTMGIRAVAAGSLTDVLDREIHAGSRMHQEMSRSEQFKIFAKEQGVSAAFLAHRYALSMENVDTTVIGVKNRDELAECVNAERAPRFTPDEIKHIDGLISD